MTTESTKSVRTNLSFGESYVGVILAAGVGSRLRPITNSIPKPLVTIAGRPIIDYQFEAYRKAGISELVVVVGYEGSKIRDYCKHIKDLNITIIDNTDYENTNNMYSFYLAKEIIGNRPFILNNGDVALEAQILSKLLTETEESSIAVDTSEFNDESMKIAIDSNGYVCDISKTLTEEFSAGCSIDFYKFNSKDGLKLIRHVEHIIEVNKNLKDWTEVALREVTASKDIRLSPIDISGRSWCEIDNHQDLAHADRMFANISSLVPKLKAIFFDLDGTVYVGGRPVPGAAEAIHELRQGDRRIFFLSNNSSKSPKDYVSILTKMGVAVSESEIILSTHALTNYLNNNSVASVYVLGTESLKNTLTDNGINVYSSSPEYVVLGYDTELKYNKMVEACAHINRGVDIIATHSDIFCPSEAGPIPDVGAMMEAIRLTTGKSPVKIFGKPNNIMVDNILNEFNLKPSEVLIVGDRLDTDIRMANLVGAHSLLVMSGATSRDELQSSNVHPTYILNSIADIVK